MITNPILLAILIIGTVLLTAVASAPFLIPPLTRLWRKATSPGRTVFVITALCAMLYGGTKTNQVDQAGGTNDVELAGQPALLFSLPLPSLSTPDYPMSSVTPEDIARGWQRLGPFTNADISYAMPEGAVLASNWWRRGAFEDATPVSNLWAFTWGKVRFALKSTNEIVAIGAPMSAIPFSSRLWSAADPNGAFRITWENFAVGRQPLLASIDGCSNGTINAQIEFHENGDYVTRSNEVETIWRRIDPADFDGDGYLNDDDMSPCDWDEGADLFYGPANELPWRGNADAYCDVTIEASGPQSQWVYFKGDGPSDYSDPLFLAKPNVPYDVKILIGKTYNVTSDAPIRVVGRSSSRISVSGVLSNAFTVVWPVTFGVGESSQPRVFAAPPPLATPPPPSGSRGGGDFSISVTPDCLNGIFSWSSNRCCQVEQHGDEFAFSCSSDCRCGGCSFGGTYAYEGYSLPFGDISCGCHYVANDSTSFSITAPQVVFKGGALVNLCINFIHGDGNDCEQGTLTLVQTSGNGKVRLWETADKTREVSTFTWDVADFSEYTCFVEGVETSDNAADITFKLTWSRPGGSAVDSTATMTCAEVLRTEVFSPTPDILDGSPNQQPFDGHTNWNFDVTHSPDPDKHFGVLFRDVANADLSVRDLSVRMRLVVQPDAAPVGTASWFPLHPTPDSGQLSGIGARVGELANPKVGGVYHIGSCFAGSPTNECSIVLPLAGAEMIDVLYGDLAATDGFVDRSKDNWPRRWYTRALFASWWFIRDKYGYYRGRPDNADNPTVWYYNQVNDSSGKGAIGTLLGVPIHIEKLSNLLAAYACEKLEVPMSEQGLAQWFGTGNDESANLSWTAGTRLAHGSDFLREIGYMVTNAYQWASEKCRKVWPNPARVDNHRGRYGHGNFNREFSSPGFIYLQH